MKSEIFKSPFPYLAILVAHIIWGMNFVIAKLTLQEFPVMSLAFTRFALAAVLLIPFMLNLENKKIKVESKHFLQLVAGGLLIVTFNIAFFYEGLTRSSAINASAIQLMIPVVSVIGGWWFLKEKIYWINLLGIGLGIFGTFVIIGIPLLILGTLTGEVLVGNILLFLSAGAAASGALVCRKVLKIYSPIIVTMVLFLVGAVSFLTPAIFDYIHNPHWVDHVSILGILGFLFIAILSSVSAFFLLFWGMKRVGVIQESLFQYIEPAIAATLAVPLLGERISYSFIVGTALIILGVYWGTLGKSEHHHTHLKHHRS